MALYGVGTRPIHADIDTRDGRGVVCRAAGQDQDRSDGTGPGGVRFHRPGWTVKEMARAAHTASRTSRTDVFRSCGIRGSSQLRV